MRNKVLFFFIFISGWVKAQQGGFEIQFISGKMEDNSTYQLVVNRDYDSIETTEFDYRYIFYKDYLSAGEYTFKIYELKGAGLIYTDTFSVLPGKITYAKIIFNSGIEYKDAEYKNTSEDSIFLKKIKYKQSGQFVPFFYGSNLMLEKNNPVKNEFGISFTGQSHFSFSKYIGIFGSYGFMFSQSYFTDDSSLVSLQNRFWERYSGLNLIAQFGIRTSTRSLQSNIFDGPMLDLGITYYFPVIFRHTAVYPHQKYHQFNIHQYTDIRVFSNLIYDDFGIFIEHRILDFINGQKPELPKFRIGISFFIS
ncbi:MAG: hypothetical protein ACOZCO_07365 [Bacteroidota bacterium]